MIIIEDPTLAPEAYRLEVTSDRIMIMAGDSAGVNWAGQTLRQLLPPSVLRAAPDGRPLSVPAVTITDEPRFGWRGIHLDVARHFLPLPQLFHLVDLLALHKLNRLHLHLSDDQGWRFECRSHPRLHEVGGWRTETRRPADDHGDGTPHGGFYTQDQLRSLVGYAAQRAVLIVPELDLPGHASAVLAGYPDLGNHPNADHSTATTFGIFDSVLNVTDATMAFVFDVYAELLEVFDSPYIHVGGDECPRTEWQASADAQHLARQRGLAGPDQLQRWFTEQLRIWLAERGRTMVGWDEICDDGPVPGAVVMAWRDARYGVAAAETGHQVIQAPSSHTYFDYYPGDGEDEPYAIGGLLTTRQVYGFDPVAGIVPTDQDRVIGVQGQVWTEYLPTIRRVEYALFPRACALSEIGWSSDHDRSWTEFELRLAGHLTRLDALGVDYRPESGPRPWQRGGSGHLPPATTGLDRLTAQVRGAGATNSSTSDRPAGVGAASHSRASNGHSSTQMPQYMHSDQSMANRSSTFRVRSRAPAGRSGIGSVCESMVMHQLGHSRAQIMHEVQAGSISRIVPWPAAGVGSITASAAGPGRRRSPRPPRPGRRPAHPEPGPPRPPRSGTPGGTIRRRLGDAAVSPGSLAPGQADAGPRRQHARPCASACPRSPPVAGAGAGRRRRTRRRTVRPPRARARPRRRTRRGCCPAADRRAGARSPISRGSSAVARSRSASTTRSSSPRPISSTHPSQSKKRVALGLSLDDASRQPRGVHGDHAATRPVSWSSTARSASGGGGQPGTYTSTVDQLVDALGHRVRVPVGPAGGRAGAEGDHRRRMARRGARRVDHGHHRRGQPIGHRARDDDRHPGVSGRLGGRLAGDRARPHRTPARSRPVRPRSTYSDPSPYQSSMLTRCARAPVGYVRVIAILLHRAGSVSEWSRR